MPPKKGKPAAKKAGRPTKKAKSAVAVQDQHDALDDSEDEAVDVPAQATRKQPPRAARKKTVPVETGAGKNKPAAAKPKRGKKRPVAGDDESDADDGSPPPPAKKGPGSRSAGAEKQAATGKKAVGQQGEVARPKRKTASGVASPAAPTDGSDDAAGDAPEDPRARRLRERAEKQRAAMGAPQEPEDLDKIDDPRVGKVVKKPAAKAKKVADRADGGGGGKKGKEAAQPVDEGDASSTKSDDTIYSVDGIMRDDYEDHTGRHVPIPEDRFDGSAKAKVLSDNPTIAKALQDAETRKVLGPKRQTPNVQLPTATELSVVRGKPPTLDWPEEGFWQGGSLIGRGGYGSAWLFCHVDENENVQERVVIKDCHLTPANLAQTQQWYGDPRDGNTRQHVEIAAMQMYSGRDGADSCVSLRHSVVKPKRRWYRLYMDFCPHGSLQDILDTYIPAKHDDDKERRRKKGKGRTFVPEPFLWAIMEALAEACLALERSDFDSQPSEEIIVHRDIKPGNIFLDLPRSNGPWPAYPHSRLGDYGNAVITSEDDALNPHAYNGREGTPWWQPPEMLPMVHRDTARPLPVGQLTSATNVWGIGNMIIALMNGQNNNDGTGFYADNSMRPSILQVCERYSKELHELARRCSTYWPDQRISLLDLRKEIQAFTSKGSETEGMGRFRTLGIMEGDEGYALQYKPDVIYRLGEPLEETPL